MRFTLRNRLLATVLGSVMAAAVIGVASANSVQHTTGGCTGWGDTYIVSTSYAFTQTDATATGCNWVYSQGTFVYNGSAHLRGPGWWQDDIFTVDVFENVVSVGAIHNLCNAGGPCSGSQQWATSD